MPMALAVMAGAAITAGPWIVYDLFALLNRGEPAPALYDDWGDLAFFLSQNLSRVRQSGMPLDDPRFSWVVFWGLPVLLGVVRLFAADCERRIRVYVVATAAVALIAFWSPFTDLFIDLFAPRYVARKQLPGRGPSEGGS